jgi:hypothetical protein
MSHLFQIFTKHLDTRTLLRLYIQTNYKYRHILDEACDRMKKHRIVYSLEDEDNVITNKYIIQVNKKPGQNNSYTVAIHTDNTYVLVNVMKKKIGIIGSFTYTATIQEVMTKDNGDYNRLKEDTLPYMFIEFIAFDVDVCEAPNCRAYLQGSVHQVE